MLENRVEFWLGINPLRPKTIAIPVGFLRIRAAWSVKHRCVYYYSVGCPRIEVVFDLGPHVRIQERLRNEFGIVMVSMTNLQRASNLLI